MDPEKVIEKLIEVHRGYQDDGGFDDAGRVNAGTRPLADLKGFESDFIPEIVRRVAREFGCPLKTGARVRNIYVDGGQKLPITEVAHRLIAKYAPKEVAA